MKLRGGPNESMVWYATHGTDCSVTRDLHLTWGHFFSHGAPMWPWPVNRASDISDIHSTSTMVNA